MVLRGGGGEGWGADADLVSGEVGMRDDSDEDDPRLDESPDAEVGADTDKYSREADKVSDHVNDKGCMGANWGRSGACPSISVIPPAALDCMGRIWRMS